MLAMLFPRAQIACIDIINDITFLVHAACNLRAMRVQKALKISKIATNQFYENRYESTSYKQAL
jgi:hypothetical protein